MLHRELLAERGVQAGARWSKYKEALAEESRFQDMPKDDREQAFRDYVAKLEARPFNPTVMANMPVAVSSLRQSMRINRSCTQIITLKCRQH